MPLFPRLPARLGVERGDSRPSCPPRLWSFPWTPRNVGKLHLSRPEACNFPAFGHLLPRHGRASQFGMSIVTIKTYAKAMRRTTIAVQIPTRDRIAALARVEQSTIDALLTRLLDEHEEHEFWKDMAVTSAEDYKAAMEEDGTWPGDYDFSAEDALIRADERG